MWDAVVLSQFDPLRVDEDQPNVVRRRPRQDRRDERIDAARLSGAGRAGDEDVRHFGQIGHHSPPVDVPAERHFERMYRPPGLFGQEHVAELHELALSVGHLHADGRAARDGGKDPDVVGGHGVRDVLAQRGHLGDLHAGAELEFVTGDGRPDGHAHESRLDAVRGQRLFEHPPGRLDRAAVDLGRTAALQEGDRR